MLDKNNTLLIVIDFQERMLPHIRNREIILKNSKKLIKAFKIFNLPIIYTKQKKLGKIVDDIEVGDNEIEDNIIEKITFSCFKEEKFVDCLRKTKRNKCLIIGIEAHICVLQTALDLIENGYTTYVAVDCIGSRNEKDKKVSIEYMIQEGVIPTTAETAIYEILETAETPEFKKILEIVKK
ncbi:MAG TPA: isochorismatase family protein [Thermoplasmatales archaeon]|nr:isochorismatase family protein [Thermoplasmatales archaeon]